MAAFVRERTYLKNVSSRTVQWYGECLSWPKRCPLTADGIKEMVLGMREAGLKATSVNSRLRAANAYFRGAQLDLHADRMREPSEVLPVFSEEMVQGLLLFKPREWYGRRLRDIVCVLLDCGLRVEECLALTLDVEYNVIPMPRADLTAEQLAEVAALDVAEFIASLDKEQGAQPEPQGAATAAAVDSCFADAPQPQPSAYVEPDVSGIPL